MTDTSTAPAAPETQATAPHQGPIIPRPETDADALRAIARVKGEMHERVQQIQVSANRAQAASDRRALATTRR